MKFLNLLFDKKIELLFLTFISLTILFGRAFMGYFVLSFRLGELLIAFNLFFIFFILFNFDYFKLETNSKTVYLYVALLLSYLLSIIFNSSSLLAPYTYKSSSYLLAISMFFFGLILYKNNKFKNLYLLLINCSLFLAYILSTVYYPEFLLNFFTNFSDKWDFLKASSLVLSFFLTILFNFSHLGYTNLSISLFFKFSGMFLPLILFKSRGAFIALFLFFTFFFIFIFIQIKKKGYFLNFMLLFLVFLFLSTSFVLNQDPQDLIGSEVFFDDTVRKLANQKDTKVDAIFTFYSKNQRLYSIDGNINWRLQIWQDVLFDLRDEGLLLNGYGYNEKIPAMKLPERMGKDGLNENVHNFVINIIARGGFLQLFLYLLFIYFLIQQKKHLIIFILPVFITSFFDASMENAHFPILFYLFLGYFYKYSYLNKRIN